MYDIMNYYNDLVDLGILFIVNYLSRKVKVI